jgi:hypothetical protein
MRSTAGNRTTLTGQTGTPRRTAGTTGGTARTGGVTRPSLANVPGREKKSTTGPRAGVGTGGWAGYKALKAERSEKYPRFEVEKTGRKIFKFAQAEPFAFIYRHWVAKRPFTCIGEDCPLCGAGDRPKPVVFYNVIDLDDASTKVWEMTADPTRRVQSHYDELAEIEKTLDDEGYYFKVSKAQKERSAWEYTVTRIKTRDLEEEWRVAPLDDGELAAAMENLYDESIIYVSSRDDLVSAVEQLED